MNGVLRSLSAVLVGLLLVFFKDSVMPIIVRFVGASFFLPALVSIINIYKNYKGKMRFADALVSIVDVGSMLFGAWLMISPVSFIELLVIVLAVILLCFSVYQIYMVMLAYKHLRKPWALLATPLLMVVLAVLLLANPFGSVATATVILGVCAIVSGISDILIFILVKRHASEKHVNEPIDVSAKELEAKE